MQIFRTIIIYLCNGLTTTLIFCELLDNKKEIKWYGYICLYIYLLMFTTIIFLNIKNINF